MRRLFFLLWPLLLSPTGLARADSLTQPLVFFNPHVPLDMANMWTDAAPWQTAANKVNVLVLVDWWVRDPTNTAQLSAMLAFAREHHMRLDLDVEPVTVLPTDTCGQGEGYELPSGVKQAAQIVANLGATIDWYEMDEPVWFGHYATDPQKCQYPMDQVIQRVLISMRDALTVFPNAKITDIEPIPGVTAQAGWQDAMNQFHDAFIQQLGRRISAIMLDVGWEHPTWEDSMTAIHAFTRQRNIDFGYMVNSTELDTSDAQWISDAVSNFETVEGRLHIIPEQVQFITWDSYPTYNMPETSPTAQTWLINRYPRPLTTLQVQFVGAGVHGRLTTLDGKPIANVTVQGFKPGVDLTQPLPVITTQGTVPAAAVNAQFAVRVNAECACDGLNDLLLGAMTYQETVGGTLQSNFSTVNVPGYLVGGPLVSTEQAGGVTVTRIIAAASQMAMWNGPVFPVTAGAQYQMTVAAGTIGGVGWNGNVNLIWLGANGVEIQRATVTPTPGKALVASATTGSDGRFVLPRMPRSVDGPAPVTVEFDGGNGTYRSTVWTPLR